MRGGDAFDIIMGLLMMVVVGLCIHWYLFTLIPIYSHAVDNTFKEQTK